MNSIATPEPLELTPEELRRITKRRQHAAQARVLELLGIPYRRHPMDGSILVGRQAFSQALHHSKGGVTTDPGGSGIRWLSSRPGEKTGVQAPPKLSN